MFQALFGRPALLEDWRKHGAVEVAYDAAADVLGQIIDNPILAREVIDGLDLGDTRTLSPESDEKVTVSRQREQCVRIYRAIS